MIYFISGHRDITDDEMNRLYNPAIVKAWDAGDSFVVGDYWGVDEMAQTLLASLIKDPIERKNRVTVYHMFEKPRVCKSEDFNTCGGFRTDEERDAAMTNVSDADIAFVREGKRMSGTAQNIVRRHEFKKEIH